MRLQHELQHFLNPISGGEAFSRSPQLLEYRLEKVLIHQEGCDVAVLCRARGNEIQRVSSATPDNIERLFVVRVIVKLVASIEQYLDLPCALEPFNELQVRLRNAVEQVTKSLLINHTLTVDLIHH